MWFSSLLKKILIALPDLRNSDLEVLIEKIFFFFFLYRLEKKLVTFIPLSPLEAVLLADLTETLTSDCTVLYITQVQCSVSQSVIFGIILDGTWGNILKFLSDIYFYILEEYDQPVRSGLFWCGNQQRPLR